MLDAGKTRTEVNKLPFPFNNRPFCHYEPIEQKIDYAKVLIVNNLLRYQEDMSELARKEWGENAESKLTFERNISSMALNNIAQNIKRLVKQPKTLTVHLSELAEAARDFNPDAIVLSGTLSDFDYYNPQLLEHFKEFITKTEIPVLGICGGHQLIGVAFGNKLSTLDNLDPWQKRGNRIVEYQYRFIKIVDQSDPIFAGVKDKESGIWQDYTKEADILRVWQNHGLKVHGVPHGFKLLATAYLCKNQMMVKRTDNQLIYTVQFHLEKSFEDWSKNPTRWEHPNESRDGRILFENFLKLALEKRHSN
ncbi:MAG: gamma-glutamyl-gamma-aminobutyrate hydrolase family protein [Pyrinomonadaceae bacterium]|nr:gamma-glutamyl-gamma-aminobutyrate hydrolase family protein [Pyrinomonadaceae bacterium]